MTKCREIIILLMCAKFHLFILGSCLFTCCENEHRKIIVSIILLYNRCTLHMCIYIYSMRVSRTRANFISMLNHQLVQNDHHRYYYYYPVHLSNEL